MKEFTKIVKSLFKWIGIVIWVFLIYVCLQVPQVETTPTYAFEGWKEFHEAMRQISIPHHILLIILSTVITIVMEWLLGKWVGHKLDISKKMTLKNWIWGIGGGLLSFIVEFVMLKGWSQHSGTTIYTATLQTQLAIPLFIAIVVIAPVLEEFLFQSGIQKGIFKKLNPWIAIILTSLIFGLAHTITFNMYYWSKVASGIIYAYVYQKTDDIKMPIASHAVSNLIPFIFALF